MRQCRSCTHPRRVQLEADLLDFKNGLTTLAVLEERWGISDSALLRHADNHMDARKKADKVARALDGLTQPVEEVENPFLGVELDIDYIKNEPARLKAVMDEIGPLDPQYSKLSDQRHKILKLANGLLTRQQESVPCPPCPYCSGEEKPLTELKSFTDFLLKFRPVLDKSPEIKEAFWNALPQTKEEVEDE